MSSNKTDDAVSEYLREVEARLGDLPLLQRRELMADLEAHIASERSDRHVQSEGEVLEILERLGSPEVVAAAAYEEAGTTSATGPLRVTTFVARRGLPKWMWAAVIAAAVVLVLGVCGVWSFSRTDVKSVPAAVPAAPAPR
jgi:uncharacterized membrane protein